MWRSLGLSDCDQDSCEISNLLIIPGQSRALPIWRRKTAASGLRVRLENKERYYGNGRKPGDMERNRKIVPAHVQNLACDNQIVRTIYPAVDLAWRNKLYASPFQSRLAINQSI